MRSRFFFFSFILFILSLVFIGIGIGRFTSKQSPVTISLLSSPEPTSIVLPSSSGSVAGQQFEKAVVKRVIDGDTIELTDGRRVRYIGIDTPETVDPRQSVGCFGKEAAAKNKELVLNQTVELEKDVSETDRYGRLLRYVYVEHNNQRILLNQYLVAEGYATAASFPPDIKYQNLFTTAQIEAQTSQKGLWSSCVVSATPEAVPLEVLQIERSTTPVTSGELPNNSTSCLIKGNISAAGEKIYHIPGCGSYDKTAVDESQGERWFCSETEAQVAGWRKAKNC